MVRRLWLSFGLLVLFIFLAFGSSDSKRNRTPIQTVAQSGPQSGGGNKSNPQAQQGVVVVPPAQKVFVATVETAVHEYATAPNELKKTAIRMKRGESLKTVLPKLRVSGWVGALDSMKTNRDGSAYISIWLAGSESTYLKTWNNTLSDIGDGTLIKFGSEVYNTLSEMKEGTLIQFDGTFFGDRGDYIRETSMTEGGSMTEPEFLFKFTKVSPYTSPKDTTKKAETPRTDGRQNTKKNDDQSQQKMNISCDNLPSGMPDEYVAFAQRCESATNDGSRCYPVDLNKDGIDELIIVSDCTAWCGNGPCEMVVLAKNSGRWSPVYKGIEARVMETVTHGYVDLVSSARDYSSGGPDCDRKKKWSWDGGGYRMVKNCLDGVCDDGHHSCKLEER